MADSFTGSSTSYVTIAVSSTMQGQTFTATGSYSSAGVGFKLYKVGTPGPISLFVYAADGSHKPTGEELATVEVAAASVPDGSGNATWVDFLFDTALDFTNATEYCLVLGTNSAGPTDYYGINRAGEAPYYANGYYVRTTDEGLNWDVFADNDLYFQPAYVFTPPAGRPTTKRLIAIAESALWYEDVS